MSRPTAAVPPPVSAPVARAAVTVSAPPPLPTPPAPAVSAIPPASSRPAAVPTAQPASARPSGRPPINPFLAHDPNQKAKRLARALISDIIVYYPQKHQQGLRDGTLKELFREEIKKSYEEYVDQMGKEFAESTSHFQDALNDVFAGGKRMF
ncbi:MAG: hypothetical protein ABR543_00430 [Gemmatimonadaceae bacterium]